MVGDEEERESRGWEGVYDEDGRRKERWVLDSKKYKRIEVSGGW